MIVYKINNTLPLESCFCNQWHLSMIQCSQNTSDQGGFRKGRCYPQHKEKKIDNYIEFEDAARNIG